MIPNFSLFLLPQLAYAFCQFFIFAVQIDWSFTWLNQIIWLVYAGGRERRMNEHNFINMVSFICLQNICIFDLVSDPSKF